MLRRGSLRSAILTRRHGLSSAAAPREFTYFDNLTVVDGIAMIRFNGGISYYSSPEINEFACIGPEKMNTVSEGLQKEAKEIFFHRVMNNPDGKLRPYNMDNKHNDLQLIVKAAILISSKDDNFIAGADINMLKNIPNKADLKDICMQGHAFFNSFKASGKPLIAAIHGACLGAGLEWAMYCDYRIATTSPKTVLGLPEVKIGLMPGLAGTYHLPRLIGYPDALDCILTGKHLRSDKAKKMGLVHLVVDPAALETVAIAQTKAILNGKIKLSPPKESYTNMAMRFLPFFRDYVFDQAKKTVDKQTGGHYPAPYAILDVLKTNINHSRMKHLEHEAAEFARLAATPQSEALMGIFLGSTAVKKHNFGKPKHDIKNVAVLGAGLMGGGIAQVSLDNGKYRVLMKDRDLPSVSRGEANIDKALQDKLKKKRMTNHQYCETTSRLISLYDNHESWKKHFAQADIVIEAVFEEIGVKHKVLQEMEEIIPAHCIFASNTSAIPIGKIAEGSKRPERVIGMHYFSPVPQMPLLEIITHSGTAPEVAAAAMVVGSKQGKTPIFVKDVPGFFVNRALSPMMSEVSALVQEGVDLELLDKVRCD